MLLIIAAFNEAFGIILNKIILSKVKLVVGLFAAIQFFFLASFSALTLPVLGAISPEAFWPINLAILLFLIGTAVTWNLLYYRAIQMETVESLEVILLTQPLITVLLSAIVFASERHIQTLVAAIVASLILIISHLNHHKIKFDRWEFYLLLAILLMAVESIFVKILIQYWSPAALYTARTLGVFLTLSIAVRPTIQNMRAPTLTLIVLSAIAGTIYKIIQFIGYANYGIVFTTLILILSPVFVLTLDRIVLHEKIHLKQILAMFVIIAAVVYGTLAR